MTIKTLIKRWGSWDHIYWYPNGVFLPRLHEYKMSKLEPVDFVDNKWYQWLGPENCWSKPVMGDYAKATQMFCEGKKKWRECNKDGVPITKWFEEESNSKTEANLEQPQFPFKIGETVRVYAGSTSEFKGPIKDIIRSSNVVLLYNAWTDKNEWYHISILAKDDTPELTKACEDSNKKFFNYIKETNGLSIPEEVEKAPKIKRYLKVGDSVRDAYTRSPGIVTYINSLSAEVTIQFTDKTGNYYYSTVPIKDVELDAELIEFLNTPNYINNMKEDGYMKEDGLNMKDKLVGSAKDMGAAALQGVKLAAVNQANEAAYNKVKSLLVSRFNVDEATLEDPKVKEGIKFILPLMLHPAATLLEDKMPHAGKVRSYCELTITDNMRTHGAEFIGMMIDMFGSMVAAAEFTPGKVTIDYSKWRLPALRKRCKELRIEVPAGAKKEDLCELLQEAEEKEAILMKSLG